MSEQKQYRLLNHGEEVSDILKNCRNCFHSHRYRSSSGEEEHPEYDKCILTGHYCFTQRACPAPPCDDNLSGWQARPPEPPKPPRRSLRKYLADLIWT